MNTFEMIKAIYPTAMIYFEQTLFSLADQMLPDYKGGNWKSVVAGMSEGKDLYHLVVPMDGDVKITALGGYGEKVTTATTAGAVLTVMALNHTLNDLYLKDRDVDALIELFYALQTACYDSPLVDSSVLAEMLD